MNGPVSSRAPATGGIGPNGENLIFLISQPRAGSTLLQRILAGHPEVFSPAEPWIMLHPLHALKETGYAADYNSAWARDALRDFCQLLPHGQSDYLAAVRAMAVALYNGALSGTGKRRFLDKTPRYYSICPELREAFPAARFIFLLRNPLGVLASVLESWVGEDWPKCELFRQDLLAAPGLLARALEESGSQAMTLRYEQLVSQPEAVVSLLCGRLELEFDPGLLHYGSRPKPSGHMGDQIGIHRHQRPVLESLEKWRRTLANPRAGYFARRYLDALDSEALNRLGYPPEVLKAGLPAPDTAPLDANWRRWADEFFGICSAAEALFGPQNGRCNQGVRPLSATQR